MANVTAILPKGTVLSLEGLLRCAMICFGSALTQSQDFYLLLGVRLVGSSSMHLNPFKKRTANHRGNTSS